MTKAKPLPSRRDRPVREPVDLRGGEALVSRVHGPLVCDQPDGGAPGHISAYWLAVTLRRANRLARSAGSMAQVISVAVSVVGVTAVQGSVTPRSSDSSIT